MFYTPVTYTVEDRGGVLLLIKDNLNPTLFVPDNADAEILRVAICPHTDIQWQVGVCYTQEEDQAHMIQKINNSINTTENSNCLLLGDFYFRKKYWSKREGNSQLKKSFIDTLNDNFWYRWYLVSINQLEVTTSSTLYAFQNPVV